MFSQSVTVCNRKKKHAACITILPAGSTGKTLADSTSVVGA